MKNSTKTKYLPLTCGTALLALITGCVSPLQSPSKDLAHCGKYDGIVVGSILVKTPVSMGATNPRPCTVRLGPAHGEYPQYTFEVFSGVEKMFASKLSFGDYEVRSISWKSDRGHTSTFDMTPQLRNPWDDPIPNTKPVRFTVRPATATYVGALAIQLPERVEGGLRYSIEVRDNSKTSREWVQQTYGNQVATTGTQLMRADTGEHLIVPYVGDFVMDPTTTPYLFDNFTGKPCHQHSPSFGHPGGAPVHPVHIPAPSMGHCGRY
ncbi:MAG: hypothetical protein C5B50_06845 [Verrucomicrobia bacterium]|nr:MAG: hypothetical protein C5B50_06845 [Verrucomicrobiota bacterium]